MGQHTRKVINPDQAEMPFLNSLSAEKVQNPNKLQSLRTNKQNKKKPKYKPNQPRKKGAAVQMLYVKFNLLI